MKWLLFEMHLPAEALEGFRREKWKTKRGRKQWVCIKMAMPVV